MKPKDLLWLTVDVVFICLATVGMLLLLGAWP